MPNVPGDDKAEYAEPVVEGIFCWTCPATAEDQTTRLYTVLLGPLFKLWVEAGDSVLMSELGAHKFMLKQMGDSPLYLISYDHPKCAAHGKFETFELHTTNPDEPPSIDVPMSFSDDIIPFMEYKVHNGLLYKAHGKNGDMRWELLDI